MPVRSDGIFYWEGEKPRPLTIRYVDENGDLDASIAGATLVAKTKIDEAAEADVTMTNNGDGTATIDWPTGTSVFVVTSGRSESFMRIDIQVTESPKVWFMDRFQIPVKKRT